MPWRSTPPDLALGSGALSLKPKPSNFSGTGAALAKEGDSPQTPAAAATLLFRNSRRLQEITPLTLTRPGVDPIGETRSLFAEFDVHSAGIEQRLVRHQQPARALFAPR